MNFILLIGKYNDEGGERANLTSKIISYVGGNVINPGNDFEGIKGHMIGVHVDSTQAPYVVWSNGTKDLI